MTYTFDMKICDNEVDWSYNRFPASSLKQIAKLVVGKRVTFKGKQVAKILGASVASDSTKTTKAGDTYLWVRASVNIELNDETSALIYEIEHGSKNPISVGCSVEHIVCSICGAESCNHVLGDVYGGQLCYKELYGVNEIYGWMLMESTERKEQENQDNQPRICDVLGVDVEERFTYPGMVGVFHITQNGCLINVGPDGDDLMICVPTLINNPGLIMKVPKWTPQEIEDAKAIQRMFGMDNFTKQRRKAPGFIHGDISRPSSFFR